MAQSVVGDEEDSERRARFPLGAAVTRADLAAAGGEVVLDRLREAEPVSWVPALGMWLVTGHRVARDALAPRTPMTVQANANPVRAALGWMMLTTDGQEHRRLRDPFEGAFRMRDVERAFGEVARAEAAHLSAALPISGEAEIGAAFAAPYAVRMAGRVLGLPLDDVERIDGLYRAFADAMGYADDPALGRRAELARAELDALLLPEIARSRARPDGSVAARAIEHSGGALTDAEIAAQLRVILFGAIETIQAGVMNTLLLLLRHPGALDAARSERAALQGAADEALRLIPPVAFAERWTREPTALGGVPLEAGAFVGVSVIAANRDPAVFPDPLRFDPHRPNARHGLSFAFGEHHCIGMHLARLELVSALDVLLGSLSGLAIAHADDPAGFAFRRPATLRLRWSRRRV